MKVHLGNLRIDNEPDLSAYGSKSGTSMATPWLSVNENYTTVNAEAERNDSGSVLSWYRELAGLRLKHLELVEGSYSEVFNDNEEIYGFVRQGSKNRFLIVVNFTGKDVTYDPSAAGMGEIGDRNILVSSYRGSDDGQAPVTGLLRPYEAVIFRK